MKITEIITEELKKYGDIHDDHRSAFTRGVKFPDITNQYYHMYRAGVNIAGQSGDSTMKSKESPLANNMFMMAYHPKEMDMIRAMAAEMGHTMEEISDSDSHEPKSINSTSPVKARGPIQRKL